MKAHKQYGRQRMEKHLTQSPSWQVISAGTSDMAMTYETGDVRVAHIERYSTEKAFFGVIIRECWNNYWHCMRSRSVTNCSLLFGGSE